MGMIADKLRANLKRVAESDARMLRATEQMLTEVRAINASIDTPQLAPADPIADAIALLREHGYTITPPVA